MVRGSAVRGHNKLDFLHFTEDIIIGLITLPPNLKSCESWRGRRLDKEVTPLENRNWSF